MNTFTPTYIITTLALITSLALPFQASANMSKQELFELVNAERMTRDYDPLLENPLLQQAAYHKAQALFAEQRFAHDLDEQPFYAFIDEVGYNYNIVGENLAIDYTMATDVVAGWMNSPAHRANILNHSFEEMGIAVTKGTMNGVETTLVVQLFGTPKDALIDSTTIAGYYDSITTVTQHRNFGLAAAIMGTATVEAGTIISYIAYSITRRKKND